MNAMRPAIPPDHTAAMKCSDGLYAVVPCGKDWPCPPETGTHKTIHGAIRAAWRAYEVRVRELEAEGLTRSDAQGVADAEAMKRAR